MESYIILFLGFFVLTLTILYFWSIFWSFKDATARGKSGFAVATLVALFAWPFGLLYWTIIRPENVKLKETVSDKKKFTETNKYVSDFKEMPLLLKILLLLTLYLLVTAILDFIQMKPVAFEYFNTGFPKNFTVIWYIYSLLFDIATIIVYFKRSYTILKKYLYISLGIVVVSIFNSIYFVANLPAEQRLATTLVYLFSYVFGALLFVYQLNQKKYFNKT